MVKDRPGADRLLTTGQPVEQVKTIADRHKRIIRLEKYFKINGNLAVGNPVRGLLLSDTQGLSVS